MIQPRLFSSADSQLPRHQKIFTGQQYLLIVLNIFCSFVFLPTAPKLRYKKMWSLRKVENGHLVGDDPVPESHGATVPLEGGLLLNGNDSWLDMGNFEGQ